MTTLTATSQITDDYDTATATGSVDRVIRISTAVAVLAIAGVAAYVSYWHAYAVVRAHGETGITARLEPATIDGLVYASSMVLLYAARHRLPVPSLARWLLGLGIAATLTAKHGPGLVPRAHRSSDRGLAGHQPRRLVRTPGLAGPHRRGAGARASATARQRQRGGLCSSMSAPDLGH